MSLNFTFLDLQSEHFTYFIWISHLILSCQTDCSNRSSEWPIFKRSLKTRGKTLCGESRGYGCLQGAKVMRENQKGAIRPSRIAPLAKETNMNLGTPHVPDYVIGILA